ncbi:MAG TPA: hypothetical protein VGX46_02155 [Vicinamibacterales bacterium]|jgi:YHS domain-containing protein|nr:hypothetical protein [Vicinamibacterales bacterium]
MVTDPVCKMTIDEKQAAGESEYHGKAYYLCKPNFDANPSAIVKQG